MSFSTARAAPLLGAALLAACGLAGASSHREGPFITTVPKADGTDFYMFRSYEANRDGFVTIIANYQPLQDAYGGPNYFLMDPNVLYEIHVDNNGDAKEDLTFQFRFQNTLADVALPVGGKSVSIPLVQAGPVSAVNDPHLNVGQSYTVTMVVSGACHRMLTGLTLFAMPCETSLRLTALSSVTKSPAAFAYPADCKRKGGTTGKIAKPFMLAR